MNASNTVENPDRHGGQSQPRPTPVLFALGFRPLFLLAGLYALVGMGVWIAAIDGLRLRDYYGGIGMHSHEMVFGYAAAVITGFLLTAARNWTGIQTLSGSRLAGLCGLWLLGRILPWLPALPGWLIAVVDLAFLPCVMVTLGVSLYRGNKRQQLIFVILLGVLSIANLMIHLQILGLTGNTAGTGIYLAVYTIILLITLLGGRVIPMFTEGGLLGLGIRHRAIIRPWVDRMAIYSTVLWIISRLWLDEGPLLAGIAILAALAQGLRLAGWFHSGVLRVPLLWILYSAYAWIVAGFVLSAAAALGYCPLPLALHGFTAGTIGLMTMGMMARVSLGHSGRALVTPWPVNLAFGLLNLAVLMRVLPALWLPQDYRLWLDLAGGLWLLAFALFLWVYIPILTRPRVDGKPG